jgi:hypothetical protein
MTAIEAIKPFIAQHPKNKFAITDNTLGVWIDSLQAFYPFAWKTLVGDWCYTSYDILVNGEVTKRNWIEVK